MTITLTSNYNLKKPSPGTERDVWGGELNQNWDSVDTLIKTNADAITLNTTLDGLLITQSTDYKDSVRIRSSVNVVIATPGATIDGMTMVVNDRFLLTAQTILSQNGIYVWNGAAVAATRSTDADTSIEVTSGMIVPVDEGTSSSTLWLLSTPNPITLDTTSLAFIQVNSSGGVKTNLDVNTFPLTIGANHKNRRILAINGAANVVINVGNVMQINDEFDVFCDGTGTVTLTGTGGAVIKAAYGTIITRQNGWVNMKKYSATVWQMAGDTFTPSAVGAQPLDATLTALSGLVTANNQLIMATGLDAFSMINTSVFQAANAFTLFSNTTANLIVGYTSTAFDNGTVSTGTLTPNPALGNLQRVINNGAHTLAPPSVGTGDSLTMVIKYTNGATAGAVTTTGFTKVTGDTYNTTNGNRFLFYISVIQTASHLNVVALQ